MLTAELREFVAGHNIFNVPVLRFNGIDFGFIIRDGFVVLGPGEDAGQILEALDECDEELQTAMAIKVELNGCS